MVAESSQLRIHVTFPVLPPVLNGIGDYTALFARALARHGEVTVLTGPGDFDAVEGVTVRREFEFGRMSGLVQWVDAVVADQPDWLVLQYNPFSYGRWGFCPGLPVAVASIKRRCPRTRIALMVHEPFVPAKTLAWAVATTWQRSQLLALGHGADRIFFSIEPWAWRFERWFPGKHVEHLPVGSNIPHARVPRHVAREQLNVGSDCVVIGLFGGGHPSRLFDYVRDAVTSLASEQLNFEVIYIGPHGDRVSAGLGGLAFRDLGPLVPTLVSQQFSAMDVYLVPFIEGVSTRRGSLMVGLQHGVATVTTYGRMTDSGLVARNGEALLLSPATDRSQFVEYVRTLAHSAERRAQIGEAGQRLFDEQFAWDQIVARFVQAIGR